MKSSPRRSGARLALVCLAGIVFAASAQMMPGPGGMGPGGGGLPQPGGGGLPQPGGGGMPMGPGGGGMPMGPGGGGMPMGPGGGGMPMGPGGKMPPMNPGGGGQQPGGGGGGQQPGGGGATGSGVKCPTKAPFGRATTVTITSSKIVVTATSCPQYDWSAQKTPNGAYYSNTTWTFKRNPIISKKPTYVGVTGENGATNSNPVMGAIGVAVNGVQIFGNSDALKRDAFVYEGATFNPCGGHASPQGAYHYHTDQMKSGCVYTATTGKHSPLFGIMADGIPIYGPLGDKGKAPKDLDECGGHTDSTYSFYHYHVTTGKLPYTVACLKGCIFNDQGNMNLKPYVVGTDTCKWAATQYDYSKFKPVFSGATSGSAITGRKMLAAGEA